MRPIVLQAVLLLTGLLLSACAAEEPDPGRTEPAGRVGHPDGLEIATFSGGCFWCVEADFEKVPGVAEAVSGYTGGRVPNPTYEQVTRGTTGHIESVQVHFDPQVISYGALLEAFWRMVDPTDGGGQFSDRGEEYTTAIWYHSESQRAAAEGSRSRLSTSGRYSKPVITPIREAMRFYEAEEYHQDYAERNPIRYSYYRYLSGRDQYLERAWGGELKPNFNSLSGSRG